LSPVVWSANLASFLCLAASKNKKLRTNSRGSRQPLILIGQASESNQDGRN
jgi:hypothetical protein